MTKRPNKRQCVSPAPTPVTVPSHHRISPRPKRTTRSPRVFRHDAHSDSSHAAQHSNLPRPDLRSTRRHKSSSSPLRKRPLSQDDLSDEDDPDDPDHVHDTCDAANTPQDSEDDSGDSNRATPATGDIANCKDSHGNTTALSQDGAHSNVNGGSAQDDASTNPSPTGRRVVTRALNKSKTIPPEDTVQINGDVKPNPSRKPNTINHTNSSSAAHYRSPPTPSNNTLHTINTRSPPPTTYNIYNNRAITNLVNDEVGWSVSQLQRIAEAVKHTNTVNGLLIARELRKLPRGGGAFSGSLACRASKYVTKAVESIRMIHRHVTDQCSENGSDQDHGCDVDMDADAELQVTAPVLTSFIGTDISRVNQHARMIAGQTSGRDELLRRLAADAAIAESEAKLGFVGLARQYTCADAQGIMHQINWLHGCEANAERTFDRLRRFLSANNGCGGAMVGRGRKQGKGAELPEDAEDAEDAGEGGGANKDSGVEITDVDMDMELGADMELDMELEVGMGMGMGMGKRMGTGTGKRMGTGTGMDMGIRMAGGTDMDKGSDIDMNAGGKGTDKRKKWKRKKGGGGRRARQEAVDNVKMQIESAKSRGNAYRREAERVRRESLKVMRERDTLIKRIHSAQRVYVDSAPPRAALPP